MYQPTATDYLTLKKGMTGWAVWALQLNLPITADGVFGPTTDAAVKRWQFDHKLTDDGIAGPSTQRSLCIRRSLPAEALHKTPIGLLQGIIEGESGYSIPCTSYITSDGGRDYGPYQDHLVPSELSDSRLAKAFKIADIADNTAEKIRTQKNLFYGRKGAQTHRRAWELALLYHNWPYAAERLSRALCIYTDCSDDQPKQWIIDASGGRLKTPNEWVAAYISSKTLYVTAWTS